MNKNILIGVCIVAIVILAGLIFFTVSKQSATKEAPKTVVETYPDISARTGTTTLSSDQLLIAGQNGSVQVKNFLQERTVVSDTVNQGYYYLGNHFPVGTEATTSIPAPAYVITYIETTQYFNIGLFKEPLKESRLEAEEYLMNQLGISKEQMCLLKYMVSVPGFVSQAHAGESLGFSFCPGAVAL